MTLLRHIRLCNTCRLERFAVLRRDGHRIGYVRRDHLDLLRRFPAVFRVDSDTVELVAPGGFEALTQAVDRVVEALIAEELVPKWRNEFFTVAPRWGEAPLFKLDRGALAFFGVRAYGVHLNGFRPGASPSDDPALWIGRRAKDKKVAPGKLDNLVAGGIADGHGVRQTLVKEAAEEADMPGDLIARAWPVGALSYRMETGPGLRDDVLFLYDIATPEDFVPRNTDGEIDEFTLMPAAAVLDLVRRTDDFKFNVNLVIIDFALRHGLIGPEDPEYLDLVAGLRRPLE